MITIYPGREVKKGLDNLYKKVERHLCEEENLIQVKSNKMARFSNPVFIKQNVLLLTIIVLEVF